MKNIFEVAKKFTDAFFDGLKSNSVDKMLAKAEQSKVEEPILAKMREIIDRKSELEALIKKYSKK